MPQWLKNVTHTTITVCLARTFSKWPPNASLCSNQISSLISCCWDFPRKLPCKAILFHFPNHNWSIISRALKRLEKNLSDLESVPLALCSIGHLKPSFRPTFQETSQDGTFGYWSNSEGILLVASSSCPGSWIVLTLKGRWWCGKMRIHFFQFRCVTSSHLLRWLSV